jgi:hypothetical protein
MHNITEPDASPQRSDVSLGPTNLPERASTALDVTTEPRRAIQTTLLQRMSPFVADFVAEVI